MIIATAHIELVTPYCQSRFHNTPKLNKESADAYEKRTWRERLHVDENDQIVIPGLAFANCIKNAARHLKQQIPGKGKTQWTKYFEAGIVVLEDIPTGVMKHEAIEKQMFVPSTGVRGDGKRVMKSYPILVPTEKSPIKLTVPFRINDETITAEVFAYHLMQAGSLIGVGSFRVANCGTFGQFDVLNIDWEEFESANALPPINFVKPAATLKGVA